MYLQSHEHNKTLSMLLYISADDGTKSQGCMKNGS